MKKSTSFKTRVSTGFNRTLKISFETLLKCSKPLFEDINSPTSLALWLMLDNGEYDQYLSYQIQPNNYLNPDKFRLDYQCSKLFAKYEDFPKVRDTKHEAIKSFIECEASCRLINKRIRENGFRSLFKDDEWSVIFTATQKINRILKDPPKVSDLQCSFGPGLNIGLSNGRTSILDKLLERPTSTKELSDLLISLDIRYPAWQEKLESDDPNFPSTSSFFFKTEPSRGSRLSFVPKNARTDRPICIEPLINGFIQSGIGTSIRKKLLKAGCDLRSQEYNQQLAHLGSVRNDLATVDLSSASDTISCEVVKELLSIDWYDLLFASRSHYFSFKENGRKKWYPLEKISSMGNGFTFELETLLFLGLARATCDFLQISSKDVNVYGDDIIIPSSAYDLFDRVLHALGFKVSEEKSFTQGPFRESCGSDWFLGQPVRPLFLKKTPTPAVLMSWCNHLRRISKGDPRYYRFWLALKGQVPPDFHKLVGPDGQGDGHFIVSYSEWLKRKEYKISHPKKIKSFLKQRLGWYGILYHTMRDKPLKFPVDGSAMYTLAMYKTLNPSESPTEILNLRKQDKQYILTARRSRTKSCVELSFSPWKDLDPWVTGLAL